MPLDDDDIARAAERLDGARRSGQRAEVPDFRLESAGDAYRVQDAVAARHGPAMGWKVGAKSREATPNCAPLLAGALEQPAPCHRRRVRGPVGVEVEIAFVLGRAFPAAAQAPERTEILDAIASCHVAIELCAMRWRADLDLIDPLWKLADNQMNESLLLGPEIPDWRSADLGALEARLAVDGAIVETPRRPADDDLLGLLVWLVRHCVVGRGGLPAEAAITTGSWTGMHFVTAPADLAGSIGSFPPIEVAIRG
jgi:2-keto-4-pentenoate hydratase